MKTTGSSTNRISALKRLTKSTPTSNNSIHRRLSAPTTTPPIVTDARQLLSNRNKPVFDARQLLSRQSSKTLDTVEIEDDNQETFVITRSIDGRLTSGIPDRSLQKKKNRTDNLNLTEPISFTKTISNPSFQGEDDDDPYSSNSTTQLPSSDQKVVISFVNDQYRKRPRSPSPPPIIRRLHNASIQTTHSAAAARLPIRTNSHRRHTDDSDELPAKRNLSRNTIADEEQFHSISKAPLKRAPTNASISARLKQTSLTQSNTDASTVLITNLHSTVTEDDVMELFGEVGPINEIKTLSRGCVQIVYSNQEHAEQAVAKYHNRLLDGKFMYVSLQQPTSYSTKSSKISKLTTAKDNSSSSYKSNTESLQTQSNKVAIDPTFIRQALFNPSNSTAKPVQFQVKL